MKIKLNTLNSKKTYTDQMLISKLAVLKKEQKYHVIWAWIKNNQITYTQFTRVLDYLVKLESEDSGKTLSSATIEVIEPTPPK